MYPVHLVARMIRHARPGDSANVAVRHRFSPGPGPLNEEALLPSPVGVGRFVIRATRERGVGVPFSRSLATASREADQRYTGWNSLPGDLAVWYGRVATVVGKLLMGFPQRPFSPRERRGAGAVRASFSTAWGRSRGSRDGGRAARGCRTEGAERRSVACGTRRCRRTR
jgi:hypothetical protein